MTAAVECWIGVVREGDKRVVRLAGRLGAAHVPELLRACSEERSLELELDLTDLVSADESGIEALQRIRGAGTALTGAPGYIQMKLDSPVGAPRIPLPKGRPGR